MTSLFQRWWFGSKSEKENLSKNEGSSIIKLDVETLTKNNFEHTGKFKRQGRPFYEYFKDINLKKNQQFYERAIKDIKNIIYPTSLYYNPHFSSSHKIEVSDNKISFYRPFFHSSLSDRVKTRPSLSNIEKKWITFQLLKYLEKSEFSRIPHGDIKANNVMLTSFNWVYVVDRGYPFKPVYLDSGTDFSNFFHMSGDKSERDCFLAPERTVRKKKFIFNIPDSEFGLLHKMDTFSVGCVIYILWSGSRTLFKYENILNKDDPKEKIDSSKIEDIGAKDLIKSMTSFNPNERKSAREYLREFHKVLFPPYFDALYELVGDFLMMSYEEIVDHIAQRLDTFSDDLSRQETFSIWAEKFENMYNSTYETDIIGLDNDGYVIIINILCSIIRNLKKPSSILKCLYCMVKISKLVDDRIKLQYIFPYIVSLIGKEENPSPIVRSQVIKSITDVLLSVENIPTSDIYICQEYLMPIINKIGKSETETIVLHELALNLSNLIQIVQKFYEYGKSIQHETKRVEEGSIILNQNYKKTFKEIILQLLQPSSPPSIKKAIITNISTFFSYFRPNQDTNFEKNILYLIFSCFKSDDVGLICTAFENIVGVCSQIAPEKTVELVDNYIIHLIYDKSEIIVDGALNCLSSLCDLDIFKKRKMIDYFTLVSPLLLHPNAWIRFGASAVILNIRKSKKFTIVDTNCFLLPILRDYLTCDIHDITKETLMNFVKPPISRESFEMAIRSPYNTKSTEKSFKDLVLDGDKDRTISLESRIENDFAFKFSLSGIKLDESDFLKLFLMKDYIKKLTQKYVEYVGITSENVLNIFKPDFLYNSTDDLIIDEYKEGNISYAEFNYKMLGIDMNEIAELSYDGHKLWYGNYENMNQWLKNLGVTSDDQTYNQIRYLDKDKNFVSTYSDYKQRVFRKIYLKNLCND